jgi:hypothetical protein
LKGREKYLGPWYVKPVGRWKPLNVGVYAGVIGIGATGIGLTGGVLGAVGGGVPCPKLAPEARATIATVAAREPACRQS